MTLLERRIAALNGSEAIALAVKQSNADLVAAYPITPQTIIVERFAKYVADGEVNTEFICAESEHSALSACVGGSLAGGRVFTATASQGLALMHEALYLASGLRCPIVMAVANRALSAPINIHSDHSDAMGSRDSGWIQLYAESVQEAYDLTMMSFKIAEDERIQLPVMVNVDGYVITHSTEGVTVLEDAIVRDFLGTRKALHSVDPRNPTTFGALALPDFYYEFKRQQEYAMSHVSAVLREVASEFSRLTGRLYDVIDSYALRDARAVISCLGSTGATARAVARRMRRDGLDVGVLRPILYRPFPVQDVAGSLRGVGSVAVLDKAWSFGAPYGPLCSDIVSSLYRTGVKQRIFNIIYGLGGRDIGEEDLEAIFREALAFSEGRAEPSPVIFYGVRE